VDESPPLDAQQASAAAAGSSSPAVMARALSRDVVIYTIGTVAANAILYLSVPIYTRVFEPAEYSQFVFVTTVSGLLGGVLVLGGDTALARFWFQDSRLAARRSLCLTWIGFLALWALLVCALLTPFASLAASYTLERSSAGTLFVLALATLPLAQTSRLLAQVMRNQFRPVAFVFTGVLLGCLSLVLGVAFAVWAGMGIPGIFIGLLTAETVVLVLRTVQTRDVLRGSVDLHLLRGLLRYGVPLVPVSLSFWVFTAADRVIVAKMAGLAELGYYSVAVTVTTAFALLSGAVSQAWLPRSMQLFETDRGRAATAVGGALTYYVLGLGLLATTIAAFAAEVTAVLSGPAYAPAAEAIPLLCLGAVAFGSQTITASGLTMMHRTGRLAAISIVAAVVNIVVTITLVPQFGIVGAAGGSAATYVFLAASYLWASQRVWRIRLETRRLLVLIGLLAGVAAFTTSNVHAPLYVRALIPVGFVAVFLVAGGLHQYERTALRDWRHLGRVARGR
jgi:O-antigen/teichoic acid export membrane protein